MSRRPFRIIPYENLPFDASHFYQTDDRFCVRLLRLCELPLKDFAEVHNFSELYTDKRLAHTQMDMCFMNSEKQVYKHGDDYYYIAAEAIYDRNGYPDRRYWKPSSNIFFYIAMRGDKTLHIAETSMLTAVNHFHTNVEAKDKGYMSVAQIFCCSPEDTIPEVCKSMTAKPGKFFGNIDFENAIVQTEDEVNVIGASRYLNLAYRLEAPEYVKPNEKFTVKIQAMSGGYKENAIVNYDNFNIEVVDGYVPHTRVALKDGRGEFQAIALGLEDGETMRVKLCRRHLTGLGECTVKIRA